MGKMSFLAQWAAAGSALLGTAAQPAGDAASAVSAISPADPENALIAAAAALAAGVFVYLYRHRRIR